MIELRMFAPTTLHRHLLMLRDIWAYPKTTQRSLARAAGVSPTMVNFYLQDLTREKWVHVTGPTNRSFRYTLTPRGELMLADLENALAYDLRTLAASRRGRRRS